MIEKGVTVSVDALMMLVGPVVAFTLSVVRTAYDESERRPTRIALEGGVCAGITISAMAIVLAATEYFSVGFSYETMVYISAGIGSFVGWIGANEIRRMVLINLKSKLPKASDDDEKNH